jgi:sigma-B regulation protein RsbU (phosphoserine phosphatase)
VIERGETVAAADRTSLGKRVGILGGLFLVLVLVAVSLAAWTIKRWDEALDDRGDMRIAAAQVADLRYAFSEQETGIRGYLLTRDPAFLEPYRDGTGLARAMEARLRANSSIDLTDDLDRVVTAAGAWHADIVEPALADPTRPVDEAMSLSRFDDLRGALETLETEIGNELARASANTDDVRRTTFAVLVACAVAAAFATVLVALLFRRWVARPLASISAAARSLTIDDEQQLPDFDSPELQDVVDAIRTMQSSLAHERDRAVTAYRTLEQSAVLALHVRSELADELGDPPPGWAVGSALVPAEGMVAGDCFDLGLLDQHRMYVVLVDVTGHGAGAALDALKSKSQLRAALRSRVSPGGALDWLSRENRKDERADLLTAVVAVIDVDTGLCQYANAGHPAPVLTNGGASIALERTGPLLGAFESSWRTESVTIEPGWTLLLHTDGITEAMGAERERFGDERFHEWLRTATVENPKQLVADLLADVSDFQVGSRTDDVTLVAIHRAQGTPQMTADEPADTVRA